jgi:hypothetical protein
MDLLVDDWQIKWSVIIASFVLGIVVVVVVLATTVATVEVRHITSLQVELPRAKHVPIVGIHCESHVIAQIGWDDEPAAAALAVPRSRAPSAPAAN